MSKLQCQSLTQAWEQCKLSATQNSKYCKRHNGIIKIEISIIEPDSKYILCPKLDPDTEILMFGYLPLEDILTLFRDNHTTRDKIIKIYFLEIPNIEDAIKGRDLETLKYVVELGKQELPYRALRTAIIFDTLDIFKYLVGLRKLETFPDQYILDTAVEHCRLEIVKFIMGLGIKNLKPSKYCLSSACKNLELLKYLVGLGLRPTKSLLYEVAEDFETFKYLLELGITPNIEHLEYYSRCASIEFLKYLIVNNFAVNNNILRRYASRGLLDILKLANEKGYKMCWRILESAVNNNNYPVCEYLLDIGVKPTPHVKECVLYRGNQEI